MARRAQVASVTGWAGAGTIVVPVPAGAYAVVRHDHERLGQLIDERAQRSNR